MDITPSAGSKPDFIPPDEKVTDVLGPTYSGFGGDGVGVTEILYNYDDLLQILDSLHNEKKTAKLAVIGNHYITMDPVMTLEVSAMSRLRGIAEAIASGDSLLQTSYSGSSAFVTGGSGFLGKHLIEKLLRSTKIKKIFVLIRSKKGKTSEDRLSAILEDPLFDGLRKSEPEFASRLRVVTGDITEIKLGIGEEDRKMLFEEVNFIFHAAATTRFDESLTSATITNVRGTREVIDLGRNCKDLRALVHISTAYAHATYSRIRKPVDEEFYDVPVDPEDLIDMAERGDSSGLDGVNTLMKDWPNTYCFTKAVAEQAVRTSAGDLPVCIVRPGIVICSYREPAPGWLDMTCTYGPGGLMVGIGLGVVHTILGDDNIQIGVIPADFVNNAIIATGWATAVNPRGPMKIYTVTANERNPVSWGACGEVHRTESRKICTPLAVWYCFCIDTASKPLFWLLFTLLHTIPALIADFLAVLIGKKAQFYKLTSKGYKLFTLFSYFTTHEWRFSDRNLVTLYNKMNQTDRIAFNFDIKTLDWKELMLVWCLGCRKYILKDGLTGTEYAVKKQFWLRIANYVFLTLYAFVWYKLFSFIYSGVSYLLGY